MAEVKRGKKKNERRREKRRERMSETEEGRMGERVEMDIVP